MGYNTAMAAAQLGTRTRLVAAVGNDFPMLKNLKDLSFDLHRCDGLSTRCFLFYDDEEERICFYRGPYHEIDVNKAIDAVYKADWVHLSGIMPCMPEIVKVADAEAKIVSFNPGYDIFHYDPRDKLIKDLIGKSDYLILSSEEASHLNLPIDGLVNGAAIVTMGKNGALVVEKGSRNQIGAYPVEADSPFGAGDTYTGTFISSMLLGNDVLQSAKLASAAASFAVEGKTTTPKLDWEEIEKRAKKL
jgi:sugar/nucleoside kinase (ribokinase family)